MLYLPGQTTLNLVPWSATTTGWSNCAPISWFHWNPPHFVTRWGPKGFLIKRHLQASVARPVAVYSNKLTGQWYATTSALMAATHGTLIRLPCHECFLHLHTCASTLGSYQNPVPVEGFSVEVVLCNYKVNRIGVVCPAFEYCINQGA